MPQSLFDDFDCDFITIHEEWNLMDNSYYLQLKNKIRFSSFKSNIKLKFDCSCKKWTSAKGVLEFVFVKKGINNRYKVSKNLFIVFLYNQDCDICEEEGEISIYRDNITACLDVLFIKLLQEKEKEVKFDDRKSKMSADHDKERCELCKLGHIH